MSTLKQQLAAVNRWRSQFNPLRGLTIQRAASLLEEGERGAYADLQWTYRMMEKRHPTLRALKLRRLAAIARLDWNIKTVDDSDAAKRQAEFLRECYDRLDNLREAIRFLALAEFRGYAHLERQQVGRESGVRSPRSPSETNHLEPVEQWFWCRDGLYGAWEYNAEAASGRIHGASVDMSALLVREVDAPLNEIALIQFVRSGLCNKDWDAFIECYGIPRPVVVMPPNVPPEKEGEYRSAAESIADGQSGAVPSGTEISWPPAGSARQHPFLERLQRLDEELVLAGTGGKLTMLSSPTGIGQGAAAQHEEVFLEIAAAEALEISEVFQKQFDALLLAERFPGQPALAYFELALPNKDDVGATIEHAVKLAQAGYAMDAAELSERTGYRLAAGQTARSAEAEPASQRGLLSRLRRGWEAVKNSYPDHPGRPGERGGSLPRGEALGDLFDEVAAGSDEKKSVVFGEVDEREAALIKAATGLEVGGYRHQVDSDAVRHSLREHPNLTRADFEAIPEVLSAPDRITLGTTRQGLAAIKYEKRLHGQTIYVEEVRTGKRVLAMKTIYRK